MPSWHVGASTREATLCNPLVHTARRPPLSCRPSDAVSAQGLPTTCQHKEWHRRWNLEVWHRNHKDTFTFQIGSATLSPSANHPRMRAADRASHSRKPKFRALVSGRIWRLLLLLSILRFSAFDGGIMNRYRRKAGQVLMNDRGGNLFTWLYAKGCLVHWKITIFVRAAA